MIIFIVNNNLNCIRSTFNLSAGYKALAGFSGLFHIPLSYFRYAAPDIGYTLQAVGPLGIE
jgi:hypothetical protein